MFFKESLCFTLFRLDQLKPTSAGTESISAGAGMSSDSVPEGAGGVAATELPPPVLAPVQGGSAASAESAGGDSVPTEFEQIELRQGDALGRRSFHRIQTDRAAVSTGRLGGSWG